MVIYIPQNIDPYNTHLKNLIESYISKGVKVFTGFNYFINNDFVTDSIHFHHVESLLSSLNYNDLLFFEKLEKFKSKDVRFILTVHNIQPHIKITRLDYIKFYKKFLTYIDLFVHHGKSSIELFQNKYEEIKNKCHIVCHHGDYMKDMSSFTVSQEEARKLLCLPKEKKIILIFGQLQYKNASFAESVFKKITAKYNNAFLLMAGVNPIFGYNRINKIYYFFNNYVLNNFRSDRKYKYKRFSQFETYLIFVASDLAFLPHNIGLTTGIIPLAATLRKPFVYPNLGVFEEQAEHCISMKYRSGNVIDAYLAIDKMLSSDLKPYDNSEWLRNNSWDIHAERILSFL